MSYAGGVGGPTLRITLDHYLDTISREVPKAALWHRRFSLTPPPPRHNFFIF